MVLMLKPRVGLITLVSSPFIFRTIVVFPELSSPLQTQYQIIKLEKCVYIDQRRVYKIVTVTYTMRIRISFSFFLIFRMMLNSPIFCLLESHNRAWKIIKIRMRLEHYPRECMIPLTFLLLTRHADAIVDVLFHRGPPTEIGKCRRRRKFAMKLYGPSSYKIRPINNKNRPYSIVSRSINDKWLKDYWFHSSKHMWSKKWTVSYLESQPVKLHD